jgi:hypothetical protein
MKQLYTLLASCVLILAAFSGQAQNIVGDTVRMSESSFPILMFPDPVKEDGVIFTCNKNDYLSSIEGNRVRFKANVEKPASPCTILIDEGNRSHQFVLIFESGSVSDLVHNFSSVDLLKERVDFLNARRKKQIAASAPAPAAEPQNQAVATTAAPAGDAATATPTDAPPPPPEAAIPTAAGDPNTMELDGLVIKRAEFMAKVTGKLELLRQDIEILIDKDKNSLQERNKTVDNAFLLFNNDSTRRVQVRNGTQIFNRPIKTYLQLLARIKMEKPKVTLRNIQFVGDLKKGPDGKYHGFVTFVQEITGVRGDKKMFKDVTEKRIEVVLVTWDEISGDKIVKKYDVFLGNISVEDAPKK